MNDDGAESSRPPRIAEATLHAYRLPYYRAVRWSDTVEDAAEYVLLRLVADDGRVGLAEATVKRTWSGVSSRSLIAAVQDLFLPLLHGQAPSSHAALNEFLDLVPENSTAKCLVGSAMDMLLRTAAPGAAGLHDVAPGAQPIDVPLSWAVTRQVPLLMAREAAEMVERHGFKTLKVKGGQGFDVDVAAVREIRAAVGEALVLTVDANGAYGREDVADYVDLLTAAGVAVVEDPASLLADAHLKSLAARGGATLLVDFPCATEWHAQALLAAGCRALNIKPGRYGLPQARRIAAHAHAAGAQACLGLFGESLLGTLINLQMARDDARLLSFLPAELSFYLMLSEQVVKAGHAPTLADGVLRVPPLRSLDDLIDWSRIDNIDMQAR